MQWIKHLDPQRETQSKEDEDDEEEVLRQCFKNWD